MRSEPLRRWLLNLMALRRIRWVRIVFGSSRILWRRWRKAGCGGLPRMIGWICWTLEKNDGDKNKVAHRLEGYDVASP